MSAGTATSDEELLGMLRSHGPLGVIEISRAMDVTPRRSANGLVA